MSALCHILRAPGARPRSRTLTLAPPPPLPSQPWFVASHIDERVHAIVFARTVHLRVYTCTRNTRTHTRAAHHHSHARDRLQSDRYAPKRITGLSSLLSAAAASIWLCQTSLFSLSRIRPSERERERERGGRGISNAPLSPTYLAFQPRDSSEREVRARPSSKFGDISPPFLAFPSLASSPPPPLPSTFAGFR